MFSSDNSWNVLFEFANGSSDNNMKMIYGLAAMYGAPLPQLASLHVTLSSSLQRFIPATLLELTVLPWVQV